MSFCQQHPSQRVVFICKANNQFQRKLCPTCFYEFQIDKKDVIPTETIQVQLGQMLRVQEISEIEQAKIEQKFESVIEESKNKLMLKCSNLKTHIKDNYNSIEKQDLEYLTFIKKNINPAEASSNDLDKLLTMLERKTIENWNNQKQLIFQKLEKFQQWIENEVQTFSNKIDQQIEEIKIENIWQYRWQQIIEEQSCNIWSQMLKRLIMTKFQIKLTKEKEIQYIKDGSILRIEQVKDTSRQPDILKNIEQIQHFEWLGEYGENNEKVGSWTATWKGEKLKDVGGQYQKGKKQGFWKELIPNYQNKAKVYEVGKYDEGIQKGNWKYIYNDQEIGGGEYNQRGEKTGNWKQLYEGFWDQAQVIYQGQYKNGKKVGKWDIWFDNLIIGGGNYDNDGDGIKLGKWVEISDRFYNESQVTYTGEYKNGKKIDGWDIWYKDLRSSQKTQIGGGLYDMAGNGIKLGIWVEISDGFYDQSQVTYKGEYQNGNKVGRWDILYYDLGQQQQEQIGGGLYDVEGNGIKLGKWVEISDRFYNESQVTYTGEYKNGKKVDGWDIWYKDIKSSQKSQIGGGLYDMEGNGVKLGKWEEISDKFYYRSQVTYAGEYKNGKKVDRWDIWYKDLRQSQKTQIGGGLYDMEGNGIKFGIWVELFDEFYDQSQVTYKGVYKNGKKVGRWDILYYDLRQLQQEQIGGGTYSSKGDQIKQDEWVEISDLFDRFTQVTYNGKYQNGKKVGKWDIQNIENKQNKNMQKITQNQLYVWISRGGGQFVDIGDGNKYGNWVEILETNIQVTYIGKYENGKKIGRWDILFFDGIENIKIGGGSYDEEGKEIKLNKWVEIFDGFCDISQVTFCGEYKNGKKAGKWDIFQVDGQQILINLLVFVLVVVDTMMIVGKGLSWANGWKYRMDIIFVITNGIKVGVWNEMRRGKQFEEGIRKVKEINYEI